MSNKKGSNYIFVCQGFFRKFFRKKFKKYLIICFFYFYYIINYKLYSWFRVLFQTTPKEYLLDKKIEELKKILRSEGNGHVIFYYAYRLGFRTESALCHLIKRKTNLTFTEFTRKVLKN